MPEENGWLAVTNIVKSVACKYCGYFSHANRKLVNAPSSYCWVNSFKIVLLFQCVLCCKWNGEIDAFTEQTGIQTWTPWTCYLRSLVMKSSWLPQYLYNFKDHELYVIAWWAHLEINLCWPLLWLRHCSEENRFGMDWKTERIHLKIWQGVLKYVWGHLIQLLGLILDLYVTHVDCRRFCLHNSTFFNTENDFIEWPILIDSWWIGWKCPIVKEVLQHTVSCSHNDHQSVRPC